MADLAVFVISVLVRSEISSEDVAFSVEGKNFGWEPTHGKKAVCKIAP